MKTVEQNKSGPVLSEKAVRMGVSRLWWKRFAEKVSFEPGKWSRMSYFVAVGKVSRSRDVEPILLEHETEKVEAAMESKRSRSPMRRQRASLSPTRGQQPPTRPTHASALNKQHHPHRRTCSPGPMPVRSTLRK